jgi:Flp pilus assembly protein TadG
VTGPRRVERGQATVEMAVLLPLVVALLLVVLQAGLLVRDRMVVLHATRSAGRAVIVEPAASVARAAVTRSGASRATVALEGRLQPGELVTVTVTMAPTAVPVVGRAISGRRISERLTVQVEGG